VDVTGGLNSRNMENLTTQSFENIDKAREYMNSVNPLSDIPKPFNGNNNGKGGGTGGAGGAAGGTTSHTISNNSLDDVNMNGIANNHNPSGDIMLQLLEENLETKLGFLIDRLQNVYQEFMCIIGISLILFNVMFFLYQIIIALPQLKLMFNGYKEDFKSIFIKLSRSTAFLPEY